MSRTSFPTWLHWLSVGSLAVALGCAVLIAIDLARHPQRMWIMDVVWPVTALFGSVLWFSAYWRWGREGRGQQPKPPFPVMVFKGASHCGAGCMIGDVIAEWAALAFPAIAVWFGWHTLFAEKTFAVWIVDFLVAYALGVIFQYFTIAPMRHLSLGPGILAALKADTASIAAWQVGMYGSMALIQFVWFRPYFGDLASVASPEFWFAMQIAMIGGFMTAFPVNWLLIRIGWKEAM